MFNERLKLLRHEAELSQFVLAKKLGLSKSSVNMYERGEREPNLETLENIADFFNVDMDFLLGKSEHRNKSQWLAVSDFNFEQNLCHVNQGNMGKQKSAPSAASGKENANKAFALTDEERKFLDAFRTADPLDQELVRRVLHID